MLCDGGIGTNLIWDPINEVRAPVEGPPVAARKDVGAESVRGDGDATEDGAPSSVKGGSECVVDIAEPVGGKYSIRVLIPCYKEDVDIVEKTIIAIRNAVLPSGVVDWLLPCNADKFYIHSHCGVA